MGGKHYRVESKVAVGVKVGLTAKHRPKWTSESLAIFFGLMAIFLAVVCPGILWLVPFSPVVNYGILIAFLLALSLILWWQRYNILMLIRRLESKLGGEKTYH